MISIKKLHRRERRRARQRFRETETERKREKRKEQPRKRVYLRELWLTHRKAGLAVRQVGERSRELGGYCSSEWECGADGGPLLTGRWG